MPRTRARMATSRAVVQRGAAQGAAGRGAAQSSAQEEQPNTASNQFTVINPPANRRQKMLNAMAKSNQMYEESKNKPVKFQYTPGGGRLGGGDSDETRARNTQLTDLQTSNIRKKIERDDKMRQEKDMKESEHVAHKLRQRQKAEEMARKERARQVAIRRDHQQFLQNRMQVSGTSTHSRPTAPKTDKSLSTEFQRLQLDSQRREAFLARIEKRGGDAS